MAAIKSLKESVPEITAGTDAYYDYINAYSERMLTDAQKDALELFAFTCGQKLLPLEGKNSVISPLSLYYAFAMLASGADPGNPKDALMDFLHMKDDIELQSLCQNTFEAIHFLGEAKMVESIEYPYSMQEERAENRMSTSLKNSVWISNKAKVSEEYIDCLLRYYYATVGQVDFTEDQSGKEISDWVEKSTNRMIKPGLAFDKDTIITLISTLYYSGTWIDAFDPQETNPGKFYKNDGSEIEVQFMKKSSWGYYAQLEYCKVISLGLDNSCEMRFVLPEADVKTVDILGNHELYIAAMTTRCDRYAAVNLMFPKFDYQRRTDLMENAEKLNLQGCLEKISFDRISVDVPKVSSVLHDARIRIDEQGVEGAAMAAVDLATGVPMIPQEKIKIVFDRPFLFGLYERRLGAWLFLGCCTDPMEV